MIYKYGVFTPNQIHETKLALRKKIFHLLLCVDPDTKEEHKDTDVNKAYENLFYIMGGMNDILNNPKELVISMSLLKSAQIEFNNPEFQFSIYRKLVLDAGSVINKIKEV